MNGLVLSDLTWVLPKVLQKVPWQVRAAFLALLTVAGFYAIGAQVFSWPLSKAYLEALGVLAVPAGLPALSNVTVKKGTHLDPKAVQKAVDELTRSVSDQFAVVHERLDAHTRVTNGLLQRFDTRALAEELLERLKAAQGDHDAAAATLAASKPPAKKAPAKKAVRGQHVAKKTPAKKAAKR